MSLIYLILLLICTVTVSITAALFSVTGLAALFGGSPDAVMIMAGALELSKFIVVGFVYRYWGHIHRPLRVYLIFSIIVLMAITSLGIFGYLSNAYEIAAGDLKAKLIEIDGLEREVGRTKEQIEEFRGYIAAVPETRVARRMEAQEEYGRKIQELNMKNDNLLKTLDQRKSELLQVNSKVGPVLYIARAFKTDIDTAVKWLIMLFVAVFDPLAVALVFCLNLIIRLREKYRNDEYKIGSQALTSPVDHRRERTGQRVNPRWGTKKRVFPFRRRGD